MSAEELYDASVFIITNENNVIYYEEYDNDDNHTPQLIMLTNDVLNSEFSNNNTFAISKNWNNQITNCIWQITYDEIPNTNDTEKYHNLMTNRLSLHESPLFFSGYRLTLETITNVCILLNGYNNTTFYLSNRQKRYTKDEFLPAIMNAYNTIEIYDSKDVHGFLPSIGQLMCLNYNIYKVNKCLKLMNEIEFPIFGRHKLYDYDLYSGSYGIDGSYWTSLENRSNDVWSVCNAKVTSMEKREFSPDKGLQISIPFFKIDL